MKKPLIKVILYFCIFLSAIPALTELNTPYVYDIGPDHRTEVGRTFIEIFTSIPDSETNTQVANWRFGPSIFRGRLGKNEVKALVIGMDPDPLSQITFRAFSGEQGRKIQNILYRRTYHHEYLLLNSFTETPTAEFAQWYQKLLTHTFSANYNSLKFVLIIGDSAAHMFKNFNSTGLTEQALEVVYLKNLDEISQTTPLPQYDFNFGSSLLYSAQSMHSQMDSISVMYSSGQFNNSRGFYGQAEALQSTGSTYMDASDFEKENIPWQPSRVKKFEFDLGPGEWWASVLSGTHPTIADPIEEIFEKIPSKHNEDLQAEVRVPISERPYGAHAFYRGNFSKVEVLVLADQFSHDDMIVGRALVGSEGQKLQSLLHSIGAQDKYLILRTLPVDTLGSSDETVNYLIKVTQSWRERVLEEVFKKNTVKVIFTLGKWANQLVKTNSMKELKQEGVLFISLSNYSKIDDFLDRNIFYRKTPYEQAYNKLAKPNNYYFSADTTEEFINYPVAIPRKDLPWGIPRWWGAFGNQVDRKDDVRAKRIIYKAVVPYRAWISETED